MVVNECRCGCMVRFCRPSRGSGCGARWETRGLRPGLMSDAAGGGSRHRHRELACPRERRRHTSPPARAEAPPGVVVPTNAEMPAGAEETTNAVARASCDLGSTDLPAFEDCGSARLRAQERSPGRKPRVSGRPILQSPVRGDRNVHGSETVAITRSRSA